MSAAAFAIVNAAFRCGGNFISGTIFSTGISTDGTVANLVFPNYEQIVKTILGSDAWCLACKTAAGTLIVSDDSVAASPVDTSWCFQWDLPDDVLGAPHTLRIVLEEGTRGGIRAESG